MKMALDISENAGPALPTVSRFLVDNEKIIVKIASWSQELHNTAHHTDAGDSVFVHTRSNRNTLARSLAYPVATIVFLALILIFALRGLMQFVL